MLQPDLFFAYGMTSALAAAASKELKEQPSPWVNRPFISAMLWLSILYVPQVLYLVWRFPAWESMFVFHDLTEIPPWLMFIYPMVVMVLGVLGFQVTARFVRQGRMGAAWAQFGWAMAAAVLIVFVGWDGAGWKRLFYTGTGMEWKMGVEYPISAFFTSDINLTLMWLEGVVLAPFVYLFVKSARRSGHFGRAG